MSSARETSGSEDAENVVWRAFETIRGSILLLLATLGVAEILLGYVIQHGVWAGILAAWGASLVIVGLVGYAILWWTRQ